MVGSGVGAYGVVSVAEMTMAWKSVAGKSDMKLDHFH